LDLINILSLSFFYLQSLKLFVLKFFELKKVKEGKAGTMGPYTGRPNKVQYFYRLATSGNILKSKARGASALLPPVSPCTWQTFVSIFDMYGRPRGISTRYSSIDAKDREHARSFFFRIKQDRAIQEMAKN